MAKKKSEAEKQTEKELAKLEKSIAKIYAKTAKSLKKDIEDYFSAFSDEDEKKKAELEAGEITKEEYKQWRLRTMCQGKEYKALRDKIAKAYLKANQEADRQINGKTSEVYALNFNHTAFRIEKAVNRAGKL